MHKLVLIFCLSLSALPAFSAILPCSELTAQVDAKLQSKGISSYTLEVVPAIPSSTTPSSSATVATAISKGKEVGTCEGGTKRLIYTRGN